MDERSCGRKGSVCVCVCVWPSVGEWSTQGISKGLIVGVMLEALCKEP